MSHHENDTHVGRLLAQVPPEKLPRKWFRTAGGVALFLFGSAVSVASFIAPILMIERGGEIGVWTVVLALVPFLGGLLCAVLGGSVWSGELMWAQAKDLLRTAGNVLRIFRRNGNSK